MHLGQQQKSYTGQMVTDTGSPFKPCQHLSPLSVCRTEPLTESYPDQKGALMCQLKYTYNLAQI